MNSCGRITFTGDWTSGVNRLLSVLRPRTHGRFGPGAAPSHSRGQATVAGEKPRLTAFDLSRKVQRERAKTRAADTPLSETQQRVQELKRYSSQLQNVHPNVLAKHLHRTMLYQDKDVVVISKPLGVPVRDDPKLTSISSVLPVLSKMMDGPKVKHESQLFLCLELEKEMAGVLLLARSEKMAEHILHLRRFNQIQRKYWAITVGVPVPPEGVIDIPIIEREVTGSQPHYKMGLSPLFRMNNAGSGVTRVRGHRNADRAVTKYRVLDSSSGCSLVELQSLTRVKHQMRVHMAFGLSCPILGDHKYSHWNKLAPQKLPENVLGKLGLDQSKSRYLSLHLHAGQLTLPQTSQRNITVSCPLPKYFTWTLKRLRLNIPDEKDTE